jgi:archaellum component FlaG (FlaF/FlaG flagellin family)
MKAKKLVLLLDVIVVAIITIAMMTGTVIKTTSLKEPMDLKAENSDLSFDLIASPEEARVKAGETVDITLSVKNIRVGEE